MMRKRKGYPVYPLTAAQKFHFFYQNVDIVRLSQ